ncbi:MAG: serpin family protein [archaeon]|jgi:serpin B
MKVKVALFALLILVLLGCTAPQPPVLSSTGLMGFKQLDDSQSTPQALDDLVAANNSFAVDYYNKLDSNPENSGKNIFFSPFSISTAVAMTYEGADGNTAKEMRNVFYFPKDDLTRQSSFAKLYNSLNESASKGNYKLGVANALWNEKTYEFKQSFYDTIDKYYYGKSTSVDFKNAPEEQRQLINKWVEDQTQQKIKELLPAQPPSIKPDTRMVLVNAIYFKGDWLTKFKSENTSDSDFLVNSDKTVTAKMMQQTEKFNYLDDGVFQYVELPYKGEDMSMIVLLPKGIATDCAQNTDCIEDTYKPVYNFTLPSAENLALVKEKMNNTKVNVSLPKFKFTASYKMKADLDQMGMKEAFTDFANFSKLDAANFVKIGEIYHKAFVEVNEEGTEAAGATAVVVVEKTSMEIIPVFNANHPFAFYIQDNKTGEILFLGKILDPTQEGE